MSCSGTTDCTCGCCAGTSVQTPLAESNRPGLSAVSYRVGTWAAFRQSMLARLSSSDYPALASLRSRADDDFTVAWLDASAVVLDILSFYQERLANENYLRTASQLRSLIELARLIAYQPAPGVSASTYLAFTLKAATGKPADPTAPAIKIPKGTQVQSVPAQGQTPQTFETSADIQAKADWNALAVKTVLPWAATKGLTSLYLDGISTKLQPGDAILVLGDERTNAKDSGWDCWQIAWLLAVEPENQNNRTRITWDRGLGQSVASGTHQKVFALRQRAALFGYNAIDADMLNIANTSIANKLCKKDQNNPPNYKWKDFSMTDMIDLDAVYPQIVSGGWVVLTASEDVKHLYKVVAVSSVSRSQFGLSAKISRIKPDRKDHLSDYDLRTALAWVQSEELPVAPQPLRYPLYGTVLDLADYRPDLIGVPVVALFGTRQKIAVADKVAGLTFIPDDDPSRQGISLNPGDVFTLAAPPAVAAAAGGSADPCANVGANSADTSSPSGSVPDWSTKIAQLTLSVEDAAGRTGTIQIQNRTLSDLFSLAPSDKKDPVVSEYVLVSSVAANPDVNSSTAHTLFHLRSPLAHCYDRMTTAVNANVGPASQGKSVTEIVGSGSAATPNQRFRLKQSPLTFTQAPTPTGRQSTLETRVNGVAWAEVPSLYNQPPARQVYTSLNQLNGKTEVLFGDGTEGALLPTGENNVLAHYRVGSGISGNVGAGTLTTLMDRPLGVSGVTNPQNATGGQDPQSIDDLRRNAPQTVQTLDRAVSIRDYQNYAGTFAGIAKASALWIPAGPGRGVFLTVAGAGGADLTDSPTLANLVASLHAHGNPIIPIRAVSYVETLFTFSADLHYDPAYDKAIVKAQAFQAVSQAFGFEARSFGQGVAMDELAAIIQAIPGVVAVNVTGLTRGLSSTGGDISEPGNFTVSRWNSWVGAPITLPRPFLDTTDLLCAHLPTASLQSLPCPAEILVLDPNMTPASWGDLT